MWLGSSSAKLDMLIDSWLIIRGVLGLFGGLHLMETLIMLQPLILVQRLSIRDADAVNLKWQKERDKTRGNWLRCKCNSSSFKTCTVYTKQILSMMRILVTPSSKSPQSFCFWDVRSIISTKTWWLEREKENFEKRFPQNLS